MIPSSWSLAEIATAYSMVGMLVWHVVASFRAFARWKVHAALQEEQVRGLRGDFQGMSKAIEHLADKSEKIQVLEATIEGLRERVRRLESRES